MTTKHYIKIAEIINKRRYRDYDGGGGWAISEDVIDDLSNYFKSDNPNFDEEMFGNACEWD